MDKEHIFFENYARNWDRDRKADDKVLSAFMELAAVRPGSVILDAGCGTGVFLPYLSEAAGRGGCVEGFDYSQQMLDVAEEKFSHLANVTFTPGDVLKYHFPEKHYDVVCCLNFYPHVAAHSREVIRRLYDALVPGGMLLIMHDMPRKAVNAIHGGEPVLPPVDILEEKLISAGFSVVIAMDTERFYFIKVVKAADESDFVYDDDEPRSGVAAHPLHHHHHTETKRVLNRLSRITGHVEAIKRMIEDGRDCSDVLVQLAAVHSAVAGVSRVILKDHIDHCIVDAIEEHDTEAVENLKKAINTFVK
ncbi:MAG: metal-sensing transcriptional repressor [Megasphaera sp.]|uniref:metal-sensing transcriptional repressor n=1 Tax=Megasphaera sp. TaxID=2023260 RepID=UPI0025BFCE3F|nr:metal-sensing transcriptional repressor [Megasphaera sp.]MCF0153631.1 metal-sensing transcriptional repressor [Megasphaera sp.]MCI7600043.1 metal-sensing transcriptional repressor [Megasphaera sp.]